MKLIFPYRYSYRGKESILLWDSRDTNVDRFILDDACNLIRCELTEDLRHYSESLDISDEIDWSDDFVIDVDLFVKTLTDLQPWEEIPTDECNLILDSWNFIEDLLRTIGELDDTSELYRPEMNNLYDHMFAGNNIPAVTPPGKSYHPVLSEEDTMTLKTTLLSMVEKLDNAGAL